MSEGVNQEFQANSKLVADFKIFIESSRDVPIQIWNKIFSNLNFKMSIIPNKNELIEIYEKTIKRKKNWNKYEIFLLLFIITQKTELDQGKSTDLFNDWESISYFLKNYSAERCKLKWNCIQRNQSLKCIWSKDEDFLLGRLIRTKTMKNKTKKNKWTQMATILNDKFHGGELFRLGKHCRERWRNHLNPLLIKGNWSIKEDIELLEGYLLNKNKWTLISKKFKHRNNNSLKTRFLTLIKRFKSNLEFKSNNAGFNKSDEEIGRILLEKLKNEVNNSDYKKETPIKSEEKIENKNITIKTETTLPKDNFNTQLQNYFLWNQYYANRFYQQQMQNQIQNSFYPYYNYFYH